MLASWIQCSGKQTSRAQFAQHTAYAPGSMLRGCGAASEAAEQAVLGTLPVTRYWWPLVQVGLFL